MVWPGYPCTPLLDTGAETLDGKFIQVHCGGIALSEIKVFVDDDRQPFDVTWVDANYYGGGGSGTPACTEPHLEARARFVFTSSGCAFASQLARDAAARERLAERLGVF